MAKNVIWFILVATLALLQSTWPESLKLQRVAPELVLMLVVYFAMVAGEERAMFTGLVGGIYLDVASHSVLGHHVLCFVAVGYVAGRVATRLITGHPAVKVGLVFAAGIVHGILFAAVAYLQNPGKTFVFPLITEVVPSAFYSALLSPLVFLCAYWLFQQRKARGGTV
jgi:rod shape-determining protein MreD